MCIIEFVFEEVLCGPTMQSICVTIYCLRQSLLTCLYTV